MWIKRSELEALQRRIEVADRKISELTRDTRIFERLGPYSSLFHAPREAPVASVVKKILDHLGLEVTLGTDKSAEVTLEKPIDYWANYQVPPVKPVKKSRGK